MATQDSEFQDRIKFNARDHFAKTLALQPEDIYLFPVPENIYHVIQELWASFANKLVSLVYFDNTPCFQYSMFEVIERRHMKVVSTATHFKLKEIAINKKVKGIEEFIKNAQPTSIQDPENDSANILRKSVLDYSKGVRPEIEFIDLKNSDIHPNKREMLSDTMNFAVGLPLFVRDNPIGILWGITKEEVPADKKIQIRQQLYALFDIIEFIVTKELDAKKQDLYLARKNIEKADTFSNSKNLFYTRSKDQKDPVTSIIFRSHAYHKEYRMDASFIIPTSEGYAVSLKQFLPEDQNKSKKHILMIPGFFCRRSVMDKLAREMALQYGYRVLSMDMRGRSKQTMPSTGNKTGWTVDNYVQDDFPAVLNWLKKKFPEEETVIMGHSMGGMIPRFYSSSYDRIKLLKEDPSLPDPKKQIAGVVSITSPNYISVKSNFLGIDTLKKGLNMIPSKMITDLILGTMTFSMQNTIQTVDLKRFFKFLLNTHESLRPFSYDIGTKVITIQDFIGYKEITPSEWYFFVEDVFCEESISVIMQFVSSNVSNDKAFLSYDGKINYTDDLKNFNLPLYSVLGNLDRIVPIESIEDDLLNLEIDNKVITKYDQGHLGIIFHPETVKSICSGVNTWIKNLKHPK
jgi:predicted alpha/beta-fold hydrolase